MNTLKKLIILTLISTIKLNAQATIQDNFKAKVKNEAKSLVIESPNANKPVSVNATAILNSGKTQLAVVIKVKILEGWHIYAMVPETEPYVQSEILFEAPDTVIPLNNWEVPDAYPYENMIFVYKDELVFTRYFSLSSNHNPQHLKAGLFYQTCNERQCLPPNENIINLNL